MTYTSLTLVQRAYNILTNTKKGPKTATKAIMMRYLLHVVGDMHQPLHNSNFFNETFPKGDLGGNMMKIALQNGTLVNLHAFWDAGAFRIHPSDDFLVRPLNDSARTYMENWANQLMEKFPYHEFGDADITYYY
jgi:hypothetical protein